MPAPDIRDRSVYPDMAHWFNPVLLGKLLLNVIVSQTFGQYADRRLMVAALDTVQNQELSARAPTSGRSCPRTARVGCGSTSWPISATGSTPPTPLRR